MDCYGLGLFETKATEKTQKEANWVDLNAEVFKRHWKYKATELEPDLWLWEIHNVLEETKNVWHQCVLVWPSNVCLSGKTLGRRNLTCSLKVFVCAFRSRYDSISSVTVPLCFFRMVTACSCVTPWRLSPFTDRIWSPRFRRPSTAAAPWDTHRHESFVALASKNSSLVKYF